MKGKVLFVTGTDTGVGKTVLTGLLLAYLRGEGVRAGAMKPFCSGDRRDADLLAALAGLPVEEVNPFYFDKPVAPAAAGKRFIPLSAVLGRIEGMRREHDVLLVEGVGGVLAPLGKNYAVREVIGLLGCRTVVASANRLGTINHTLLTVESLQMAGMKDVVVAVMDVKTPDISAKTNLGLIRDFAAGMEIYGVPYLGKRVKSPGALKKNAKFLKKTLAGLVGSDILHSVLSQD